MEKENKLLIFKKIFLYYNIKKKENFDFSNFSNFINRNQTIIYLYLSKSFLISNGKNFKFFFVLIFFLNLKFGSIFFTRSIFCYLKKNKKITKR